MASDAELIELRALRVSTDDLENYEAERELQLAQEYQDVAGMFRYAVGHAETDVGRQLLREGERPRPQVGQSDQDGREVAVHLQVELP